MIEQQGAVLAPFVLFSPEWSVGAPMPENAFDHVADDITTLASEVHELAYTPEATRTENALLGIARRLRSTAAAVRRMANLA